MLRKAGSFCGKKGQPLHTDGRQKEKREEKTGPSGAVKTLTVYS